MSAAGRTSASAPAQGIGCSMLLGAPVPGATEVGDCCLVRELRKTQETLCRRRSGPLRERRGRLSGDTSIPFRYRCHSSGEAQRELNVPETMEVFAEQRTFVRDLGCRCLGMENGSLKENS